MPYTFFGPSWRVILTTTGVLPGSRVTPIAGSGFGELWDTANANSGSLDLTDRLERVEITIAAKEIATASVTVRPTYEEMRHLIEASLIPMSIEAVALVELGWPGEDTVKSRPFVFKMGKPPQIEYSPDSSSITFQFTDGLQFVVVQETQKVWQVQNEPLRAAAVLEQLSRSSTRTNAFSIFTPSKLLFGLNVYPKGLLDPVIWSEPIVQTSDNFTFAKELLDIANVAWYPMVDASQGLGLFIVDKEEARRAQPVAKLVMWQQIKPDENVFPLLSMAVNDQAWYQTGATVAATVRKGADPLTKTPEVVIEQDSSLDPTATHLAEEAQHGVAAAVASQKKFVVEGKVVDTGVPYDVANPLTTGRRFFASARKVFSGQKADRYIRDAADFAELQLSLETLGLPQLEPEQIIRLEGVGAIFEGNYRILKIVHTMDSGGFKTSLDVSRDGVRAKKKSDQTQAAPPEGNPGSTEVVSRGGVTNTLEPIPQPAGMTQVISTNFPPPI